MAGQDTLLARVQAANTGLKNLSSGQDRQIQMERAGEQASRLRSAVARLQAASAAAIELRSVGSKVALPKVRQPDLGDRTPVEWFDSAEGIRYIEGVERNADDLHAKAATAWSEFKESLQPALLDSSLIERLRGNTDRLDAGCDALEDAMNDWRSIPERIPAAGDAKRVIDAKRQIDMAWELLEEAGATTERLDFLKTVGTGRVPLTKLDDELIAWLHKTGLAAGLVVTSR